jgi:hypothetical protein
VAPFASRQNNVASHAVSLTEQAESCSVEMSPCERRFVLYKEVADSFCAFVAFARSSVFPVNDRVLAFGLFFLFIHAV